MWQAISSNTEAFLVDIPRGSELKPFAALMKMNIMKSSFIIYVHALKNSVISFVKVKFMYRCSRIISMLRGSLCRQKQ